MLNLSQIKTKIMAWLAPILSFFSAAVAKAKSALSSVSAFFQAALAKVKAFLASPELSFVKSAISFLWSVSLGRIALEIVMVILAIKYGPALFHASEFLMKCGAFTMGIGGKLLHLIGL